MVGYLIEKLPNLWKDYKDSMKHKRKHMSFEDVIVHIRIEEENKIRDKAEKATEFSSKVNMVKSNTSWPKKKGNLIYSKIILNLRTKLQPLKRKEIALFIENQAPCCPISTQT